MNKRAGIRGAGVVGTLVACLLSQYPETDITMFEKNRIGSGSTGKSVGTYCPINDSIAHELLGLSERVADVDRPMAVGIFGGQRLGGYRAGPSDFPLIIRESVVEGYMTAIDCGSSAVIKAPTFGRRLARYIMTGEFSWYIDRLLLSPFEKT